MPCASKKVGVAESPRRPSLVCPERSGRSSFRLLARDRWWSLDGSNVVQVSPRHVVTVDDDFAALIKRAPQQDYVVRTLAKRMAGNTPLMSGELVIAGSATRKAHPLAESYPLHFRKTYYPGRLRGDTAGEFARHTEASEILGIPPPIGYAGGTFRSCLLPGRPLDLLTQFGSEPEDSNIKHADKLPLASAIGMWLLAERVLHALTTLHDAGMTHGDAELHNFIVCPAPVDVIPIDFDMAVRREGLDATEWTAACEKDFENLFRLAIFVQCALGAQSSALGEQSRAAADKLFQRSAPFLRAIDDRSGLLAHG